MNTLPTRGIFSRIFFWFLCYFLCFFTAICSTVAVVPILSFLQPWVLTEISSAFSCTFSATFRCSFSPVWYQPEFNLYHLNVNSVISSPAHDEFLALDSHGNGNSNKYTMKGYAYTGGGRRVCFVPKWVLGMLAGSVGIIFRITRCQTVGCEGGSDTRWWQLLESVPVAIPWQFCSTQHKVLDMVLLVGLTARWLSFDHPITLKRWKQKKIFLGPVTRSVLKKKKLTCLFT